MKYSLYILYLIILLNGFSGNSQASYHPYPDGWGAQWVYEHEIWNGTDLIYNYQVVSWLGDTTINNQLYTIAPSGYVRQDSAQFEAFYVDYGLTEHNIVIPQGAVAGDTVNFDAVALTFLSAGMLPINPIDTVLVIESMGTTTVLGQPRREFNFYADGTSGASFIEGIGFTAIGGFEHGFRLLCHSVNHDWVIPGDSNPGSPSATYCVLGDEEQQMSRLKLYPNPTTGLFNLTLT